MKKNMKFAVCALLALFMVFCAVPSFAAIPVRAVAGGVGGGWYTVMAGLAEIIGKDNPDINMQVIPGAGLSNSPRTGEKGVEVAMSYPPFTKACFTGTNPYEKPYDNLRAIGKGFGSGFIQFVVDADAGINSIEDFIKNKKALRIAVERKGTTDEWIFSKILEFYKVDYKTIASWGGKVTHAGYGDQAVLIKDRQVDAIIGNIAVPWTAVMEASIGRNLKVLSISKECQEYLKKNYALLPATVPAGSYSFQKEPFDTVACITQLITHKDVPEDVIYRITKAIFTHPDKVRLVHDSLKDFDPKGAYEGNGVPLHPGAEKFFKEAGYIK